jgi:hypothetical protein
MPVEMAGAVTTAILAAEQRELSRQVLNTTG